MTDVLLIIDSRGAIRSGADKWRDAGHFRTKFRSLVVDVGGSTA